jgi:hypothetical protein
MLLQCNLILLELHKLQIDGNEIIEHIVCMKERISKIMAAMEAVVLQGLLK